MRTSGGKGTEGLIMVIPIVALAVALSMANGGIDAVLVALESTVRSALTSMVSFIKSF
jgi:hypothetical protein